MERGRSARTVGQISQSRLEEVAQLHRRIDALREHNDDKARQASVLKEDLCNVRIACVIEPNLGKVFVNGNGRLLQIELNASAIEISNKDLFESRVLQTIKMAQQVAGQKYIEMLRSVANG